MAQRSDKVQTKFWLAQDLGAAELLRGRFVDYAYDVHTHDKACFALLTHGAIRIAMRGHEVVARAGDLYAIDADEPHAGWPIDGEGWGLRTLYVDPGRLQARLLGDERPRGTPTIAGPIIRDPKLVALFHGIHACSEQAGPALKRDEQYLRFSKRLFERHVRSPRAIDAGAHEDRAIGRARDFLDQHLGDRVRLTQVASAAGLPPFRLLRAFTRTLGLSPHGYQRQARLRLAARLIRHGQPLSEVAAASGFADQAHLTRSFRRTIAITPGAYRAAYQPSPAITR